MIASMANHYWTFYRQTEYLMDAAAATATMSTDRGLAANSYIQIKVADGTTGSGDVTVIGTDSAGSAQTKTLTFSANGSKVTTAVFATVTSITTTGLADESAVASVSAQAVSADGTPNLIRYSVAASRPVYFAETGPGGFPAINPGAYEKESAQAAVDYEGTTWVPREGDVAVDDGDSTEWVLLQVRETRIGFGIRPSYYSLRCKLQGT